MQAMDQVGLSRNVSHSDLYRYWSFKIALRGLLDVQDVQVCVSRHHQFKSSTDLSTAKRKSLSWQ